MQTQLKVVGICSALLCISSPASEAQNSRIENTPGIVQVTMGPSTTDLPGNGAEYCVPTSTTMQLFWLASNGFSNLAPAFTPEAGYSLDAVIAGLMQTDALSGGTYPEQYVAGLERYFQFQGMSGMYQNNDILSAKPPTLEEFTDPANFSGYNIVTISISWYNTSDSAAPYQYARDGGHDIDYLAAQMVGGEWQLAVNNPEPHALIDEPNIPSNVLQQIGVGPVPSGIDWQGVSAEEQPLIQLITSAYPGTVGKSIAAVDRLNVWSFTSEFVPGFTLKTFTMSGAVEVDTNGGSFTAVAPLAGTGHIVKSGLGTMTLAGTNVSTGDTEVSGGTLASILTASSAAVITPFGTGGVKLSGGGELLVSPAQAAAGVGTVAVAIASDAGKGLVADGSQGYLSLERGSNTNLSVTLGHATSGDNLAVKDFGTLVIQSQDPLAAGSATKLFLAKGSSGASSHNGILSPAIIVQDNDGTGNFASYNDSDGLIGAVLAESNSFADANDQTVLKTVEDAGLPTGAGAIVAGLIVSDGASVQGTELTISPSGSPDAGLILNGGSIQTTTLNFKGRTAYVYSGEAGGQVSSALTEVSSLVVSGIGNALFSGNAAAISTKRIQVNSGTLTVQNNGLGIGNKVFVQPGGTFQVEQLTGQTTTFDGDVDVAAGGTVQLSGGSLKGKVTLASGSTLQGTGAVNFSSHNDIALEGDLGAVGEAGMLTINNEHEGKLSLTGVLNFTLTSLVDDLSGGTMGEDWNGFSFENIELNPVDEILVVLNFTSLTDPYQDVEFWSENHSWLFVQQNSEQSHITAKVANNLFYDIGKFEVKIDSSTNEWQLTYTAVPEPGIIALLGLGGVLLAVRRKRR